MSATVPSAAPAPSGAPRFPGIPAIVDGSEAIAYVDTRLAEVAYAYPITPSTTMAAVFQAAVAEGRSNLWGSPLRSIEPESEHSSASAAEGVALAGGRVTDFTAGQGLILMKEVLYVISGKRLPIVFHVDRAELMAAVEARLGRFFGKRGGAVVAADLAVIEEAYDGLIDVTAHVTANEPVEVAPGSASQREGVLR
jgi:hypothetical protein